MATNFFLQKFMPVVAVLIFLTFDVKSAWGNAAEEGCVDGPCLVEIIRSNRAPATAAADVTKSARDALMFCKLQISQRYVRLDPVRMDNTVYEASDAGSYIKANFTKMVLHGLRTMRIQNLSVDLINPELKFKLNFTEWNVTGYYNATARFSETKPILGNDTFSIEAADVRLGGNSTLKIHPNGSLSLNDLKLSLEYGKGTVTFHKLDKHGSSKESIDKLLVVFAKHVLEQSGPRLLLQLKFFLEGCLNNKLLTTVNVFKG